MFEDRVVPEVLWYSERLRYSLVYQKKKAPLIFAIAGTGANYRSARMQLLQKAFFQAGFHVISLSSPTHPNFIVSASTTGMPGHIINDAEDLYHVMQLTWEQVQNRIEVSEFYLTGYSLGATQSAFIAKLDEEQRYFNFKKVLMINPPVSLYSSIVILDDMFEQNLPGGLDNISAFFDEVMNTFTEVYKTGDFVEFNDEFLYQAFKIKLPDDSRLATIIGLAFRLASANMVFVTDVFTNSGYIVPKNRVLTTTDSVTDYFKVSIRIGFLDYFNELFYPYFKSMNPALTKELLISRQSLKSIEDYLSSAEKISLVTNKDDLILAPGELDYLRQVFKTRAKIYPRGGHCGNMAHRDNVAYMVQFFEG